MAERLLKWVGPIHIAGGLRLFATGFFPPAQDVLQSRLPVSDDFVWSPFFFSVFGPTVASWGVLFGALVNQFYSSPSQRLWRAMVLSIVVWAPLDTLLCLASKFYGGAIINGLVFTALAILLYSARELINRP